LFGCDRAGVNGRYYEAYTIDQGTFNLSLKTAYLFDPVWKNFVEVNQAEPDKLGSWGSISATLDRPEGWRKIVSNSEFQLGGEFLLGYWDIQNKKDPYYGRRFGTYPNIDGSSVCVPLAVEFARQHLGLTDEQAREFVSFSKTPIAYEALIMRKNYGSSIFGNGADRQLMDEDHPVDIILVTYPSDDELVLADRYGEPLAIEPICSDAFVFIVNKDNPVDSLTQDQVRGIYSGKITDWSEVGGDDGPIMAFQREPDSGSQTGLEQLVMKGAPLATAPAAMIVLSMEGLIETVAEYDNGKASIGYSYKYYVEQLYKNENVKILCIDGVEASDTERYPLTVNYYGVIRANDGEESTGRRFLSWICSEEGQSCVRLAGYEPIYAD
jgi:phosphate transport system substrate-binding protein